MLLSQTLCIPTDFRLIPFLRRGRTTVRAAKQLISLFGEESHISHFVQYRAIKLA
jgi:hypothetical protein